MSDPSINLVFGSHTLQQKIFFNRCAVSITTIVAILALAAVVAGALTIAASLNGINIQDLAQLGWKIGTGMVAGGVGAVIVLGIGNTVYFRCIKVPIAQTLDVDVNDTIEADLSESDG